MTILTFGEHILLALLLGSVIGVERQRRQRMAGTRTNALVATSAALFVTLSNLDPGTVDHTRIAAQVVSGIGFLGAGVILRDGFSVSGLNTAATLWASAAVGCLAGLGFAAEAAVGTAVVLFANLILRALTHALDRSVRQETQPTHYKLKVVCRTENEPQIRVLMVHLLNPSLLSLRGLDSHDTADLARVQVEADLYGTGRQDLLLEQTASRLSLEASISSVSWRLIIPDERTAQLEEVMA